MQCFGVAVYRRSDRLQARLRNTYAAQGLQPLRGIQFHRSGDQRDNARLLVATGEELVEI